MQKTSTGKCDKMIAHNMLGKRPSSEKPTRFEDLVKKKLGLKVSKPKRETQSVAVTRIEKAATPSRLDYNTYKVNTNKLTGEEPKDMSKQASAHVMARIKKAAARRVAKKALHPIIKEATLRKQAKDRLRKLLTKNAAPLPNYPQTEPQFDLYGGMPLGPTYAGTTMPPTAEEVQRNMRRIQVQQRDAQRRAGISGQPRALRLTADNLTQAAGDSLQALGTPAARAVQPIIKPVMDAARMTNDNIMQTARDNERSINSVVNAARQAGSDVLQGSQLLGSNFDEGYRNITDSVSNAANNTLNSALGVNDSRSALDPVGAAGNAARDLYANAAASVYGPHLDLSSGRDSYDDATLPSSADQIRDILSPQSSGVDTNATRNQLVQGGRDLQAQTALKRPSTSRPTAPAARTTASSTVGSGAPTTPGTSTPSVSSTVGSGAEQGGGIMDYIQNAANYSGNRGADAYNSLQQQTPDQLRAALPYLLAGGAGGALGGLGGYLGSGEDEEGNSNAGRNALLMGLGGAGLGAGGLAGYNYLQNNPEVANRIRSQAGDLGTQFNQAVIDPLKQYFR